MTPEERAAKKRAQKTQRNQRYRANKKKKKNAGKEKVPEIAKRAETNQALAKNRAASANRSFRMENDRPTMYKQPVLSSKLTAAEQQFAYKWLMNLLDPTEKFKFPRPIPVLSAADIKSGQIFFNTQSDYVEAIVRPDPFELIAITQLGITSHVDITGISDFGEDFRIYNSADPQAEIGPGGTHHFGLQLSLPLTNGKYLDATLVRTSADASESYFMFQSIQDGGLYGYRGILPPTAPISIRFTNRSQQLVNVSVDWQTRGPTGIVLTTTPGTPIPCSANTTQTVSSAAVAGMAPAPADSYSFIVVTINNPGVAVEINNFSFVVSALTGVETVSPISTEYWTLGEAAYGKNNQDAAILDQIIEQCLLWSPCGLSTKFNVDQKVNDAGGRFQTAYLPSRISNQLPGDFDQQWQFIEGRKASYPVAETPFMVGAQGSWLGGRIQDYEFRKPFSLSKFILLELDSTPMVHFLTKKVASEATITMRLDWNLAFEIQTTHPAYTMTPGLFHAELCGLLGYLAANSSLLVGENPSHTKRLAQLAKQTLAHPMVQKAFKELFTLGLGILL